jgi:phospholipase A1/A2
LLHESNGQAGSLSRSMNTAYFRPRFIVGSLDSWLIVALPEVQAYIGDLSDNPTIKNYRGYGRMRLYIGRNEGPTLMASGWTGAEFNHGTYQLDLTVPFHSHFLNLEAFLMAQYFNGYGESLRTFDRKSDALRVGIGLVR